MPVINSRLTHNPKVIEDGALIPQYQKNATIGKSTIFTIPIKPVPNVNSLSNASQIFFDLEPNEVGIINDMCYRWTLKNKGTSPVELVPSPYWINRCDIQFQKGSLDSRYIYPEDIVMWYYTQLNNEQRHRWAKLSGFNLQQSGDGQERISNGIPIEAGQEVQIYMPIPCSLFKIGAIDMNHISNDIRFDIKLSNNLVVSGDINDIELNNIELIIESHKEANFDKEARTKLQHSKIHKYIYLDTQRLQYNDRTLTANAKMKYPLDQFSDVKSPFLSFCFKPSRNPTGTNKTIYKYTALTDSSTIDLESSSGQSLYANGTSIKETELINGFIDQTGNLQPRGLYCLNFSDSIKHSIAGILNSYHQFTGSKDTLSIRFANSPTAEVHNINIGSSATSGNYFFTNAGGESCPTFIQNDKKNAFDALTTSLITNLNEFKPLKDKGYVVSNINHNFNANSGSVSITFDTSSASSELGSPEKEIGLLNIVGNLNDIGQSSLATRGRSGWISSSDYQVNIFVHYFRQLIILPNGKVDVVNL